MKKLLIATLSIFLISACSMSKANPTATIDTTMGDIVIEVFVNETPELAKNFLTLAKEGKYDGTPFHRVIKDFMIQTGDFTNKDGTGGHSYLGEGQDLAGEYGGGTNARGTLSMANRGPDTNGSQFFFNLVDNTFLDHDQDPKTSKHPVFAKVISGMDIVDAIADAETTGEKPNADILMNKITISE